jgi:hypothetical protein
MSVIDYIEYEAPEVLQSKDVGNTNLRTMLFLIFYIFQIYYHRNKSI